MSWDFKGKYSELIHRQLDDKIKNGPFKSICIKIPQQSYLKVASNFCMDTSIYKGKSHDDCGQYISEQTVSTTLNWYKLKQKLSAWSRIIFKKGDSS